MSDGMKRRTFLKVLGAGGAATAATGCSTREVEKLIPYVVQPEDIVPGGTAPTADPSQATLGFPSKQRDSVWNAEASKMVDYWKRQEQIPWVRIHRVPEHAKFPHYVHVNVGLQCQTCHGPVQEMQKVYQFSSLRMGWCIECHRGQTELSAQEEQTVRQRSTFVRKVAQLKAAGDDVRGQRATWPRQRASTDCIACHY